MEKIILHAHSEWSHDCKIRLKDWVDFMGKNKVNRLYLTEHEESGWSEKKYQNFVDECLFYSTEECKLIPGLELNIDGFHVLAPALLHYSNRPEDLLGLKDWVHSQGSFLIMAHPTKYDCIPSDILGCCTGIEIKNSKFQYNWIFGPTLKTISLASLYRLDHYIGQDIHKFHQYRDDSCMFFNSEFISLSLNVGLVNKKFKFLLNSYLIMLKDFIVKYYVLFKNIVTS